MASSEAIMLTITSRITLRKTADCFIIIKMIPTDAIPIVMSNVLINTRDYLSEISPQQQLLAIIFTERVSS